MVCALAFTVAVPLRTYLAQQSEISVQQQRQAELQAKVAQLTERKGELADPAQIEAEARRRLGYVMPGETPYLVQLPGDKEGARQAEQDPQSQQPGAWYELLWESLNGARGGR